MAVQFTKQRVGRICVFLGILTFLFVAALHFQDIILRGVDFKTVYSSSKCLLDGCNPYDSADLLKEYIKGHGDISTRSLLTAFLPYQALYPPSSLFWVLPFAHLPWKPAVILWVTISGLLFATASLLMADDLFETRTRLQALEATSAAAAQPKPDPKLGRKLNKIARRAEEIADGLEHP